MIEIAIAKNFNDSYKYHVYDEIHDIISNIHENPNISASLSYLEPYYDSQEIFCFGPTGPTGPCDDVFESNKQLLSKELELLVFECKVPTNWIDNETVKLFLNSLYIRPSKIYKENAYKFFQEREIKQIDTVRAVWKINKFDEIFKLIRESNPNLKEIDLLKIGNDFNPIYTKYQDFEPKKAPLNDKDLISSETIKINKQFDMPYSKLIIKTTIADIPRNKESLLSVIRLIPNN